MSEGRSWPRWWVSLGLVALGMVGASFVIVALPGRWWAAMVTGMCTAVWAAPGVLERWLPPVPPGPSGWRRGLWRRYGAPVGVLVANSDGDD